MHELLRKRPILSSAPSHPLCLLWILAPAWFFFFFFNDTATTEIYTLSLHDALPISRLRGLGQARRPQGFLQARREVLPHPSEGRGVGAARGDRGEPGFLDLLLAGPVARFRISVPTSSARKP